MIRFSLVVFTACVSGSTSTPTIPPRTPPSIPSPLQVTWSMKIDGDQLRIDYVVHNRTDRPIVLLDQLQDNTAKTPFAVVRSDGPSTIGFTLAYVPPEPGVRVWRERRPIARTLGAHASVSGSTVARWPLRAHHNFSPPSIPLSSSAEAASLEIGYIDAASAMETERIGGELVDVPDWHALHFQKLIRSDVRRLPSQ